MNFLRQKLFMRDTPAALSTSGKPLPLNYKLSTFRWHLDSRPPSKAILVHDLFSSSASWQTLLHGSIGKMPGRGLTPRVPLELYAVELRGHNYSMSVPFPEEGSPFALTCASDVLLLQQQIIRTDAKFIGFGFGALVACHAALQSPDSGVDSLVLIVSKASQLMACDPSEYVLPSIISKIPPGLKTLEEFNDHLRKMVPSEVERSLIFSLVVQKDGALSFRLDESLLKLREPLHCFADMGTTGTFKRPVTVVICGEEEFPKKSKEQFLKHFPKTRFVLFDGDRSAGINGLFTQSEVFGRTLLDAMELLGDVTTNESEL